MAGTHEDNIFFIGDFDDHLEQQVIVPLTQQVATQSERADGRIDLYINSIGGYGHLVMHMIMLVEAAKRQGVIVRTIVPNMAFSAGSMLAITGTPGERYIDRHADHLVHYGQIASFETTQEQVTRYRKYKERQFKHMLSHYVTYTDIPKEDLERNMADDAWFIPARDCIKWGLADKYTDKLDIYE